MLVIDMDKSEFTEVFMEKSRTDILVSIWNGLGIAIILFFFIFSFFVGGDAFNGYCEAGKYFVSNHGEVTEVSREIWIISKISTVLFWIFIPLTPLGCFAISAVGGKIKHRKNRLE